MISHRMIPPSNPGCEADIAGLWARHDALDRTMLVC